MHVGILGGKLGYWQSCTQIHTLGSLWWVI